MKAMIFAAGLGTRLRPLTDNLPKALVPIGGKPLLEHLILKLKEEGFDEMVVNTHHFSGKIAEFLDRNGNFGCNICISEEKERPLETGGGIKYARNLLDGGGRFLTHNVDILSNLNIRSFTSLAREDALATLLVSERKTQRYLLFDDDMRLCGWTNIATGEIKSPYGDINPDKFRKYAFSGIQMVSDTVFPLMDDEPETFSIIDFYLRHAADQRITGMVQKGLKLADVGKIDTIHEIESEFFG